MYLKNSMVVIRLGFGLVRLANVAAARNRKKVPAESRNETISQQLRTTGFCLRNQSEALAFVSELVSLTGLSPDGEPHHRHQFVILPESGIRKAAGGESAGTVTGTIK